jgi:hypothetical protein
MKRVVNGRYVLFQGASPSRGQTRFIRKDRVPAHVGLAGVAGLLRCSEDRRPKMQTTPCVSQVFKSGSLEFAAAGGARSEAGALDRRLGAESVSYP